jgi:cation transporter-like permease
MPQSSTSRFVFMGIRVVCGLAFLAFVFHDFQQLGWSGAAKDMGIAVIVTCITYANNRQAKKIAADNMRKAGLNPDRDEATPSRKPIDNRSQEI